MSARDYYKDLNVAEGASQAEIKKSFRKLAKEYHPDRHKGDSSKEERFKEISEAYDTLSNEKKRAEYDNMRRYGAFDPSGAQAGFAGAQGGSPFTGAGGGGGLGDLGDIFGSIFGAASRGRGGPGGPGGPGGRGFGQGFGAGFGGQGFASSSPQQGANASAEMSVTFEESASGVSREVVISSSDGTQKKIKVKIPAGISDGEKIRLRGLGAAGFNGGAPGDLLVTIKVKKHPLYTREGLNIISSATVSLKTAALGGKIKVKTLTKSVMLSVPPGSQPGARLRLKGQGLNVAGKTGDLIVVLQVEIPTDLTDNQKKALEDF